MSRLAKLTFIALFLLLGSVAAALAFLSRPTHPLHFTLAHQPSPEMTKTDAEHAFPTVARSP
jgi:hypothetical protein